jgi:hypothetical protein
VDCARNEVLVIQHPDSNLRYRLHEVDEKGDRVRDQIETPDGGVARLILRDGRPLTPEEDAAERERLNSLADSPADFARHVRREQENKKTGIRLIQLMPDASSGAMPRASLSCLTSPRVSRRWWSSTSNRTRSGRRRTLNPCR